MATARFGYQGGPEGIVAAAIGAGGPVGVDDLAKALGHLPREIMDALADAEADGLIQTYQATPDSEVGVYLSPYSLAKAGLVLRETAEANPWKRVAGSYVYRPAGEANAPAGPRWQADAGDDWGGSSEGHGSTSAGDDCGDPDPADLPYLDAKIDEAETRIALHAHFRDQGDRIGAEGVSYLSHPPYLLVGIGRIWNGPEKADAPCSICGGSPDGRAGYCLACDAYRLSAVLPPVATTDRARLPKARPVVRHRPAADPRSAVDWTTRMNAFLAKEHTARAKADAAVMKLMDPAIRRSRRAKAKADPSRGLTGGHKLLADLRAAKRGGAKSALQAEAG